MEVAADRYFLLYKPRNMVSQFVSPDDVPLLGALDFEFPEGTHAIGRLDKDSEGLLLLTTDKRITRLLFVSSKPHERTYLVEVLREISNESIEKLQNGVLITARGEEDFYLAKPVSVRKIEPPLQYVKILTLNPFLRSSWLEITLTEGKFHQVRKMVKAVGNPCLRLIRSRIEDVHLDGMFPGEVREVSAIDFFRLLHLTADS